jgi:hypothetical protein
MVDCVDFGNKCSITGQRGSKDASSPNGDVEVFFAAERLSSVYMDPTIERLNSGVVHGWDGAPQSNSTCVAVKVKI